MKIKTSKLDALYSKIIRKERPICEVCKARSATQVHHYYGRRYSGTRFNNDNIVSVCFTCHRILHENPLSALRFMVKKLGEKRVAELNRIAQEYHKIDAQLLYLNLQERMKKKKI